MPFERLRLGIDTRDFPLYFNQLLLHSFGHCDLALHRPSSLLIPNIEDFKSDFILFIQVMPKSVFKRSIVSVGQQRRGIEV